MVPLPHRRRPHQSLGPHRPALRSHRLHLRHARRPRRQLAHHLSGHRPLLRQSRILHRRLRHQGKRLQRSRRRLPSSTEAALHRAAHKKSLRQTQHYLHPRAPRHPHPPAQWPRPLPLLRPVRTRLHHRLKFQFQPGVDPARSQDRSPHHDHRRHGSLRHHGQRRQSRSRLLHRQSHSHRKAHQRPRHRSRRQRLRVRAPAPQFAFHAIPRWRRQFLRHRRQIFNGLRRQRRLGLRTRSRKDAAAQSRRHRRHAPLRPLVEVRPQK